MEAQSYPDATKSAYPMQPAEPPSYQPQYNQPQSSVTVDSAPTYTTVVHAPLQKPPNFIVLSIISIFCCFFPLGVIALIFSISVEFAWSSGDVEGSRRNSNIALGLNIASIVAGITVVVVIVVLSVYAAFVN